jgi:hypothetical protein
MPITYTISRDERLIRAYATGVIRADDLHPFLDALLADPDLRPGLRGLYDASDAAPDITILQLAEVASRVLQLVNRGLGRIALVAKLSTTYRVSKTFAVLARALGVDVEVFTEHRAAEAWLEEGPGTSDTEETPLPR